MPAFGDKMAVFASTLPDWKQDILEYRFKDETRALEGLVGIEKSVRDVYANTDSREEINPFINMLRKRLSLVDARLIDADTITLPGKGHSVKNMFFLGVMLDEEAIKEGGLDKGKFMIGLKKIQSLLNSQALAIPVSYSSHYEATLAVMLKQKDRVKVDNYEFEADEVVGQVTITSAFHNQPYTKLVFKDREGSLTEPIVNPDAVNVISRLDKNDKIIIGPGSVFTSILANIAIKDIARALKEAREKGVKVICIFNPTIDNEIKGHNAVSLIRLYEDSIDCSFEDIFNVGVVNKPRFTTELQNIINDKNTKVISREMEGKKSLGLIEFPEQLLQRLERRGIKLYAGDFCGMQKIRSRKPGQMHSFEEKYGYKPEALAGILKDIGQSSSSVETGLYDRIFKSDDIRG